ncbi:uncharacterized protein TRIREDRAFT_122187 [Trichoderma reesei QM6a]|uniref:Predicted protein n=2 Tax=Hypocrea jecorina TaxID=51453 RepID=G0RLB6_HYPJQ|nr:uncharacterized protein TRIREDRAFT_122187 [Trichoderma reesei QM6a]EGR48022.1 predicted protein [Trichoderma reesei QM6a]ETS01990.1 hypothetical protein M419DRAFT_98736 [Trichoderma reesei RUT C-30]
MYPEVGSSYKSGGYSDNGADGYYSARRSYEDNSNDYYRGNYRIREGDGARDRGHHHHNERPPTNRDLTRNPQDKSNNNNNNRTRDDREKTRRNSSTGNNSNSNAGRLWERVLPPDFRPSQADPDERRRRRLKEKECEGFDWTPGIVLGLLGAAALFNHERSLVRRRKKEYIER